MKLFILKKHQENVRKQQGYTLIELLLYVSIIGALLTTVTYFYGTVVSARVKNQSIQEVNDQGTAVMDNLTQTIRNATSITTPTIGVSGPSLTLVVPTGALSPTVFSSNSAILGYNSDGGSTDSADNGVINATKFVASATGTISTLYGMIGPAVAASPNNKGQMAIYNGTSTTPTTLLASSASTTLTPSAWTAFSISSVNVTSGQTYWVGYNTNGLATTDNELRYHAGTANQGLFLTQTYGAWPASWAGGSVDSQEFSTYAPINTGITAIQVKEGAGALTSLTNSKVQISGLMFRNLSRASTPGSVQISFTLSRVNPSNTTEFDYQKTFTTTAEVAW